MLNKIKSHWRVVNTKFLVLEFQTLMKENGYATPKYVTLA